MSAPAARDAAMESKLFEEFRSLIYQEAGITLRPGKESLVSSRIGKRMRALGLVSQRDYLEHVRNDASGGELVHLIDAISTNVTSFYREADHFKLLSELLERWGAQGQRRFRIWCAAASSGEEPYTIAITAAEALGAGADVKILATDISTRVLETARQGRYPKPRVATVPSQHLSRYFDRQGDRQNPLFSVRRPLRDMLVFRRLNLSTAPYPMKGPLDVVFCRNVMIYFDNDVRTRLLNEVYRLLKPGGYLLVGHAESLTGITTRLKPVKPSTYIK
jgi:chemotaxis protein methyltransferase CheR